MREIEDAASFFRRTPAFRPRRAAAGVGLIQDQPKVMFAAALEGESHVFAFEPDEADYLASKLREAAGAVRALNDQEAT